MGVESVRFISGASKRRLQSMQSLNWVTKSKISIAKQTRLKQSMYQCAEPSKRTVNEILPLQERHTCRNNTPIHSHTYTSMPLNHHTVALQEPHNTPRHSSTATTTTITTYQPQQHNHNTPLPLPVI